MVKIKSSFAILMLVLVVSCASQDATTGAVAAKDSIDIGAILFLTNNDYANVAEAFREGIDLAVDEINANGGILGRHLRIIYEDDQLNLKKSVIAADKLVNVDCVEVGLIGLINTVQVAGPIFNEKSIPLVMLWDAKIPGLGLDHLHSLIGIGFSTQAAGEDLASYAFHELGIRKLAVIYQPDEWSQRISSYFAQKFTQEGGIVSLNEQIPLESSDFKTIILKAKEAEAMYLPFVANLDIFVRQARDLGYKGQLLSGDAVTEQVIQNAQGAAEGMYFTQVDEPNNSKMLAFKEAYRQKYNKDPEMSVFSALGYDGVYLIAEAVENAGSSESEVILNALYQVKDFEGVLGNSTMDSFGGSPKFERIFRVDNGQMVVAV